MAIPSELFTDLVYQRNHLLAKQAPNWRSSPPLKMTRLSRIVVLLRNLEHGIQFYRDGLGLRVDAQSRAFARLSTSDGTPIELNAAER